ncbi:MAG TPA: FecR domain-containing protein [Candidatus Didemnitutus sp.]|nr:FecR domain-containing protein [Candidatus Didemnitutus sp.]
MKTFALRFLFGLVVAAVLSASAWAQTKPGLIKAVRVRGEVFKVSHDGQSSKLAEGALLTESDTVTTGKASTVVLVFMNGSSIKLAPESKLAIEEFKMDALPKAINVSELKAEPSVSKTQLDLAYGEMVGDVKHLNRDGGSYYNIKTPVGAAGIRGTTFRIVFKPSGDGKAFNFTLSTAEGIVEFRGTGKGSSDVPKDKEVVVTGQIDPATNKVTSLEVSSVEPISPSAVQSIIEAVTQAIQQAEGTTHFTVEDQHTPPPAGDSGGGTKDQTKTDTIIPETTTSTLPRLTSGDGK